MYICDKCGQTFYKIPESYGNLEGAPCAGIVAKRKPQIDWSFLSMGWTTAHKEWDRVMTP